MLFPDPEAPVTQTSDCKGKETFMFFKLFSFAPIITNSFLGIFLLLSLGILIFLFPDKYIPVMEFLDLIILLMSPSPVINPPLLPAKGPRSII